MKFNVHHSIETARHRSQTNSIQNLTPRFFNVILLLLS
jgi:hypothetical protein